MLTSFLQIAKLSLSYLPAFECFQKERNKLIIPEFQYKSFVNLFCEFTSLNPPDNVTHPF